MADDIVVVACIAMMYSRRQRQRRSMWTHNILQRRQSHGEYHRLVQELRLDEGLFQRYFRLNKSQFDDLLTKVGPRIRRADTNYWRAIGPAERLTICLR